MVYPDKNLENLYAVIKNKSILQRDYELTADEKVVKVLGIYNQTIFDNKGNPTKLTQRMFAVTKLRGTRPKRRYAEKDIERFINSKMEAELALGAYII
jgi:hypothetical protein